MGGFVGTAISALLLFAVAAANIVVLRGVWRALRHVRHGGPCVDEDVGILLKKRGLLARIFRPLLNLVTTSWRMAPLGFLFGVGLESATEVALLSISATQAAQGSFLWSVMAFPALFAAGTEMRDGVSRGTMLAS